MDAAMDAAIDQNPRVDLREALNLLAASVAGRPRHFVPPRAQGVFRERLPGE